MFFYFRCARWICRIGIGDGDGDGYGDERKTAPY